MSGRMDWRRARLHGRRTLDYRFENELPDRATRWLQAVERNQRERRSIEPSRRTKIGITANSTDDWRP
jgi:hypothetical protein